MYIIRYLDGWSSVTRYPYLQAAQNMQQEHEYRFGIACWIEKAPKWQQLKPRKGLFAF